MLWNVYVFFLAFGNMVMPFFPENIFIRLTHHFVSVVKSPVFRLCPECCMPAEIKPSSLLLPGLGNNKMISDVYVCIEHESSSIHHRNIFLFLNGWKLIIAYSALFILWSLVWLYCAWRSTFINISVLSKMDWADNQYYKEIVSYTMVLHLFFLTLLGVEVLSIR